MPKKKVLFIVGSLRSASFNRTLAEEAAELVRPRADVSFLDYADVPFMNQDIEFPAPESVARVRAEVGSCDALWVVSPEYNYQIPAQLKNLLDWLSRPIEAGDHQTPLCISGKPVLISGAGGARGVSGCRARLEELLLKMKAEVVGGTGAGFALPARAWSEGVYEVPEADRARLAAQAGALFSALGI